MGHTGMFRGWAPLLCFAVAGSIAMAGAPNAFAARKPPVLLMAPKVLSVQPVEGSRTAVDVTWTRVTGDVDSYVIRLYDAGGQQSVVSTTPADTFTLRREGLVAGTAYRVSVQARGNGTTSLSSPESGKFAFTTPTGPPSCLDTGLRGSGDACEIGDVGPGGGTIFLLPTSDGNPTGKFFEVAPEDVDAVDRSLCTAWGSRSTSNDIGAGQTNTANLLSDPQCNSGAATAPAAVAYRGGGLADWYLGSVLEMRAVRLTPAVYGAYDNWAPRTASSSAFSSNGVWLTLMDGSACGGNAIGTPSCTTYMNAAETRVRPIRSFSPAP